MVLSRSRSRQCTLIPWHGTLLLNLALTCVPLSASRQCEGWTRCFLTMLMRYRIMLQVCNQCKMNSLTFACTRVTVWMWIRLAMSRRRGQANNSFFVAALFRDYQLQRASFDACGSSVASTLFNNKLSSEWSNITSCKRRFRGRTSHHHHWSIFRMYVMSKDLPT